MRIRVCSKYVFGGDDDYMDLDVEKVNVREYYDMEDFR